MLCYPESMIKLWWDIFTSIVLVAACFMTPFSLAFPTLDKYGEDNKNVFVFEDAWSTIESLIDIVFLIEIIICFNTSYYEQKTNSYVTSRAKIAKAYICGGWFIVDLMALVPRFIHIVAMATDSEDTSFAKFFSFMKIFRIGRLIKLLRLLKMAKALKQKKKMQ